MTKPDLDDRATFRRAEKWIEENCPAGLDVDWSSADSQEDEQLVHLTALYSISIPYSALLSQVRSKLNVTESVTTQPVLTLSQALLMRTALDALHAKLLSCQVFLVGASGLEPPTPTMSR